ncbi:MAG: hypothetical protein PSN46_10305, partial [Gammaproteobacteria bacterium]|nr:hypothetical protein [Gammaproteobacteria bacterium]
MIFVTFSLHHVPLPHLALDRKAGFEAVWIGEHHNFGILHGAYKYEFNPMPAKSGRAPNTTPTLSHK